MNVFTVPCSGADLLRQIADVRFTGRVTTERPITELYSIDGQVYVIDSPSAPDIAGVLLDAGVVDRAALDRGVISVGGVRHYGRLFERVPELDRDAVVVALEFAVEEQLASFARRDVTVVHAAAMARHRSGLHRWYGHEANSGHTAAREITVSASDSSAGPAPPSDPMTPPAAACTDDGRGAPPDDDAIPVLPAISQERVDPEEATISWEADALAPGGDGASDADRRRPRPPERTLDPETRTGEFRFDLAAVLEQLDARTSGPNELRPRRLPPPGVTDRRYALPPPPHHDAGYDVTDVLKHLITGLDDIDA